ILDPQSKVAHRIAIHPPPQRSSAPKQVAPPGPPPPKPDFKNEDLGERMIGGVIAQGRRTTTIWPIDSQGNDRPLTDVNEIWYSCELSTDVLMIISSARNGETTMRLTNIAGPSQTSRCSSFRRITRSWTKRIRSKSRSGASSYFRADLLAKSSTNDGKMPKMSVPRADAKTATFSANPASGSASVSVGSFIYITTSTRR